MLWPRLRLERRVKHGVEPRIPSPGVVAVIQGGWKARRSWRVAASAPGTWTWRAGVCPRAPCELRKTYQMGSTSRTARYEVQYRT